MDRGGMAFLCGIRPQAGHDAEVLTQVKSVFGTDANVTILEELSDIFIVAEPSEKTLTQLGKIQANPFVLDTQIEVLLTRFSADKEIKIDNVYLVLVDTQPGKVNAFIESIKQTVDKAGAGNISLLYIGEIFSPRADVAVMMGTNIRSIGEISEKIRKLEGVDDTEIYTLQRT